MLHFILLFDTRLQPGLHKSHKGPRAHTTGISKTPLAKTSRAKLSTQRLAELRGGNVVDAPAHTGTHHDVITRSKDLRTPEEINAVLPWVCATSHCWHYH